MRIVFGLLAFTAACGNDGGGFPVGGGGNDGGFSNPDTNSGSGSDATVDGSGTDSAVALVDANEFNGRVCLLTDPRKMDECAGSGAGGLTVRLGTASTTTTADGSFTIIGQTGSGLVWRITGPNIVSSFEPLADYQIPAITTATFNAMLAGSSQTVMQVPGEGSMMVFVSRNGSGVAGKTATTVPEGFYKAFYDGASASAWQQTSTGVEGAVWVPGIDVGNATLKIEPDAISVTAPIFDGGITWANLILP